MAAVLGHSFSTASATALVGLKKRRAGAADRTTAIAHIHDRARLSSTTCRHPHTPGRGTRQNVVYVYIPSQISAPKSTELQGAPGVGHCSGRLLPAARKGLFIVEHAGHPQDS